MGRPPDSVYFQTRTSCNGRCLPCPYPKTWGHKPLREMDEDLFQEILAQLGPRYGGALSFYFQYEPLTDKRLPDWLATARGMCPGASLHISTNGILLGDEWRRRLAQGPLDHLYISTFGGTKESYLREMGGLPWTLFCENVNAAAALFGSRLRVLFVRSSRTASETDALRRALPGVAVEDTFWLHSRAGAVNVDVPHGAPTRLKGTPCGPLQGIYVWWDGTVPLCCQCWDTEWDPVLGDLKRDTVAGLMAHPARHTRHKICQKCEGRS